MQSQAKVPTSPMDAYTSSVASVASVPAQAVFVPTPLPPRPTSSPSTPLYSGPIQSCNANPQDISQVQEFFQSKSADTLVVQSPVETEDVISKVNPTASEDVAIAQLGALVEQSRPPVAELEQQQQGLEKAEEQEGKEEDNQEEVEVERMVQNLHESMDASDNLDSVKSVLHPIISTVTTADADVAEEKQVSNFDEAADTIDYVPSPRPKSKPVVRVVRKRRPLSLTLKLMRSYADTLQPVDCVILLERCAPFSKGTRFMEYFKSEFLSKILSDLNGGPSLDTNFGRDSYTSLYSLHTFDWRKPEPPTTLVSDTAILKHIFIALDTLQPSAVPPVVWGDQGIPVVPLLRAALNLFSSFDRHRRCTLGLGLRHRHLILLLCSPCVALEPLEAEAAMLSGEVVAETSTAAVEAMENTVVGVESTSADNRATRKGILAQMRELRVAVSVFSPCEHKNLRRLAQMCNMLQPDIRRDSAWPTVIFSREISQVSLSHRPSGGVTAGLRSIPPSSPQKQQQRLQQTPPQSTVAIGGTEPSPRHPSQLQNQQIQQAPPLPQHQQSPLMRHMVGGPGDCPMPALHQTRLPVPYPPVAYPPGGAQSHTAFSGPNSIEPVQNNHLQQQNLQRSFGSGSGLTGPSSVPDAFSNTYQASPMPAPGYGLAPSLSLESQMVRLTHQSASLQPQRAPSQQQYYSPMAPMPYENESVLSVLSPAMTSDPYPRVNYAPVPSPVCSISNMGVNSSAPAATDSQPATGLQILSDPLNPDIHHQSQQHQAKQSSTPQNQQQQQQQPVPSPYAIPGTPHSAEPTNVQYHLRQHPSPYQAPQQSPMPPTPMPVSTAGVSGQYHPPSTPAYPISEMSRYQASNSPQNALRVSASATPFGRGMGEERALLWEGQLSLRPQVLSYVQILSEITSPRISFPWQKNACLMLQMEQFDRDSQMGQILAHQIPSYLLPTQLFINFKNSESQVTLQNHLCHTPASFIVGILPPLSSFKGSIMPGIIAFVCLFCTDDGHIIGLVPKDSEAFRADILLRQLHRCQRVGLERQQPQYDAGLMESQSQQQQQQQQASPVFTTNIPSLPNTFNKMVRPSNTMCSPAIGRTGNSGLPPLVGGGGVVMEENEIAQQQQSQQFMQTYQSMPAQQQPKMQQQQMRQQPQLSRQPSWQEQRQAGITGDLIQQHQQQQRSYPPYQHTPQQQMVMSPVLGGQQQQQHLCHQAQGMAMAQSVYMQQKMPVVLSQQQQQQRPQAYSGLVASRQQLRDASGRFQSSSSTNLAASAGQEYHDTPLSSSYPSTPGTPMYDMSQYAGLPPTPHMSAYVRPSPPMRPGFARMTSALPAVATYGSHAPVGRGMPRGMGVRGISQTHLMMAPGLGEGMLYENSMDQQMQQQQIVFESGSAAAAASVTPHNQPPMF